MPEYQEYHSRLERRREREAMRSHHRRNVTVALSVSMILVVVMALGGWLVYSKVRAGHKPVSKDYTCLLYTSDAADE